MGPLNWYIFCAYQSPISGWHCGPQCAQMPNFASRYQSGTLYADSDSSVGWNGPGATPNPTGAGIGAGAGGSSEADAPTTAASATPGTRPRQTAGTAAARCF